MTSHTSVSNKLGEDLWGSYVSTKFATVWSTHRWELAWAASYASLDMPPPLSTRCWPCLPPPRILLPPGMKEIKQNAAVPGRSHHADRGLSFDRRSNNYVTAFHLADQPSVEYLQPCATDMDSGLCSLYNARHQVTITHRYTDTADSPIFSLAPTLPISDVRCANRPNFKGHRVM